MNGKADVDLTNINASCKPLDGQWVASQLSIATGTSLPTTGNIEYDLSTYLPSDNYKYDVLFHIIVTTGSTGNSNAYGVISSDIIDSPVYVCGTRNPSANTVAVTNAGSVILPVAANRKLYVVRVSSNTGTFTLMAHGYRRIGTNS